MDLIKPTKMTPNNLGISFFPQNKRKIISSATVDKRKELLGKVSKMKDCHYHYRPTGNMLVVIHFLIKHAQRFFRFLDFLSHLW